MQAWFTLIAIGLAHPCVACLLFAVRSPRQKSDGCHNQFNTLGNRIRARRIDRGVFQSQLSEVFPFEKVELDPYNQVLRWAPECKPVVTKC